MEIDPEAIVQHDAKLRRLARELVRDAAAADDVVQRAWVAALEQRDAVRSPLGWLIGTVRKLALAGFRSEARRERREREGIWASAPSATSDLVAREQVRRRVFDALVALEEPLRTTLRLRFFEGLKPREIARLEHDTVTAVQARLRRGTTILRQRLASLDRDDPRRGILSLAPFAAGAPLEGFAAFTSIATGGLFVSAKGLFVALSIAAVIVAAVVFHSGRPAEHVEAASLAESSSEPRTPTVAEDANPIPSEAALDRTDVDSSAAPSNAIGDATLTTGTVIVRAIFEPDLVPAAGVTIAATCHSDADPLSAARKRLTDAGGEVRFDGLAPGNVSLQSDRGGLENVEVKVGVETIHEFHIPPGAVVGGRVVDDARRPVANAAIFLSEQMGHEGAIVATTGSDGRFSIRNVSSLHYVGARLDGYVPSDLRLVLGSPAATHELELTLTERGGALVGTVLDRDGAPLADATVIFDPDNEAARDTGYGQDSIHAVSLTTNTGADGSFRFGGLPPGVFTVSARAKGTSLVSERVEIVRDGVARVTFRAPPSGRLVGTVRDRSGAAIAAVRIRTPEYGALDSFWARSASDGSFTIEDVSTGEREVLVEADGFGETRRNVVVAPEQDTHLEIVLDNGGVIRGRVMDDAGLPIHDVSIELVPETRTDEPMRMLSAIADSRGEFVIHGVPSGVPFTARFLVPPSYLFPSHVVRGIVANGDPLLVTIAADELPSVRVLGRLLDSEGNPVIGAVVNLLNTSEPIAPLLNSDAAGRFQFGPTTPGQYTLMVRATDHPTVRRGPVETIPNQTLDFGDIVLHAGHFLDVKVRRPPELERARLDLRVHATNDSGIFDVEMNGDSGRSELLPPGSYRLFAAGDGVAAQALDFTIEPGRDTTLTVTLHAGLELGFELAMAPESMRSTWCRMAREDGTEVADLWFHRRDGDTSLRAAVSLAPGRYVARHTDDEGIQHTYAFVVAPDGPREFTLDKP